MKQFNTYLKKAIKKDPYLKSGIEFQSWLLQISINISKFRKSQGYTQKKFAEALDITQSAVARIESGQNMKCSTLWKISDVLNLNLEIFEVNKKFKQNEFTCFLNTPKITKNTTDTTSDPSKIEFLGHYSKPNPNQIIYATN